MDTMQRMNSITVAMREEEPPPQAPPADDSSVITMWYLFQRAEYSHIWPNTNIHSEISFE